MNTIVSVEQVQVSHVDHSRPDYNLWGVEFNNFEDLRFKRKKKAAQVRDEIQQVIDRHKDETDE